MALLGVALGVLLFVYWPAQAAMELLFFEAQSTQSEVVLSWGTAREIDVEGFLILCKVEGLPDSAYEFVGQLAARGGPELPAEYEFRVTENIFYGEQYCFRLEEVTTNDEPGEKRDICGYGPGVTPTPVLPTTPIGAAASLTPIIITPIPGQSPAPTLITPGVTATSTPIGQSPFETPTVDPFATATPTSAVSPLEPGSPIATPSPTTTLTAGGASAAETPPVSPTPSAVATATATATQMTSPALLPAASPLAGGAQGDQLAGLAMQATPTPLYIVVTATPTPEALAVAATLTPLPTVTATPDLGLFSALAPTAQNMMVMMLCLIFLSATGLGTLGLVTTVLYFRSQAQRRADGGEFATRRRF